MTDRTLFISDIHLDEKHPHISEQFLGMLTGRARAASEVYILGDLFETWIGDDDDDPHFGMIQDALRSLSDSGVPVYFMHGNRDFIIGAQFAERTGCTILPDPCIREFYRTPVLLSHGDQYCTDDVEYQAFRVQARNPQWQQQMLSLPLTQRRQIARGMKQQSDEATKGKATEIMDVNQAAIADALMENHVSWMLHGHTHRPAVHRFLVDDKPATRIVLGDWYQHASYLWWDKDGPRLSVESRSD